MGPAARRLFWLRLFKIRHSRQRGHRHECHYHPLWSAPIPNDPFAPLRQRFLARCTDQLAELKATRERGPLAGNPLISIAHSLAGTAGTFGFAEISTRASELETLLIEHAGGGAVRTALDALIAEIERTLV